MSSALRSALLLLSFAAISQPALAQTQTPADPNKPVSSAPAAPAPAPNPMPPRTETRDRPVDVSVPPKAPEPEPKGRWGPIDQYNKNTKCYVAGRYVPAPPLCPN